MSLDTQVSMSLDMAVFIIPVNIMYPALLITAGFCTHVAATSIARPKCGRMLCPPI